MRPFYVAIDFDGTIVEDKYPEIGSLKEDVVSCTNILKELGCFIIITSCRTSTLIHPSMAERVTQKQIMENFLRENNIAFDKIDEGNEGKVVADIYIDDRGIKFEDNWKEIVRIINLEMQRTKR
jgi:hypothetical protein